MASAAGVLPQGLHAPQLTLCPGPVLCDAQAHVVNLRDAAAEGSRGLLHPLLKRFHVRLPGHLLSYCVATSTCNETGTALLICALTSSARA